MEDLQDYGNGQKAASENVAKRIKETNILQRVVTVDDNESELVVTMDFSGKSGTFKISTQITTKNVSMMNDDVNEAVRSQLNSMLKHSTDLMIQRKREWSEEPESNQIKLKL